MPRYHQVQIRVLATICGDCGSPVLIPARQYEETQGEGCCPWCSGDLCHCCGEQEFKSLTRTPSAVVFVFEGDRRSVPGAFAEPGPAPSDVPF